MDLADLVYTCIETVLGLCFVLALLLGGLTFNPRYLIGTSGYELPDGISR